eukprot:gene10538-biopygen19816
MRDTICLFTFLCADASGKRSRSFLPDLPPGEQREAFPRDHARERDHDGPPPQGNPRQHPRRYARSVRAGEDAADRHGQAPPPELHVEPAVGEEDPLAVAEKTQEESAVMDQLAQQMEEDDDGEGASAAEVLGETAEACPGRVQD